MGGGALIRASRHPAVPNALKLLASNRKPAVQRVAVLLGAPGRTRTCDLEIRRLLLYPAELRGPAPTTGGAGSPATGSLVIAYLSIV